MNYKKAHTIFLILAFLGFVVALILIGSSVFWLGLVIIFPGLIIMFVFYRCPNCGRFLPIQYFSLPSFCPNCGEELDEQHGDYL